LVNFAVTFTINSLNMTCTFYVSDIATLIDKNRFKALPLFKYKILLSSWRRNCEDEYQQLMASSHRYCNSEPTMPKDSPIDIVWKNIEKVVDIVMKSETDATAIANVQMLEMAAQTIIRKTTSGILSECFRTSADTVEDDINRIACSMENATISETSVDLKLQADQCVAEVITMASNDIAIASGGTASTVLCVGPAAVAAIALRAIVDKIVDASKSLAIPPALRIDNTINAIKASISDARKLQSEFDKRRGIKCEEILLVVPTEKRRLPGVTTDIMANSCNKGYSRMVNMNGVEFQIYGRIDAMSVDGKVIELKSRKKPIRNIVWSNDMVQVQIYMYLTRTRECEFWESFEETMSMKVIPRNDLEISNYLESIVTCIKLLELVKNPCSKEHDTFFRHLGYSIKR
jgi:hypothetical protein